MAITDIENNDLQQMTNLVDSEPYLTILGIGEGRSKAKKVGADVALIEQANAAFKEKMLRTYRLIKGNDAQTNLAKLTIEKPNGVENVFLAVKDFGSPNNKKNINDHNIAVATYLKYNYAFIETADCNELRKLYEIIDQEVEKANKIQTAGKGNATEVAALANVQTKVKKFYIEQDCEKKQEESEQEKAKEETLSSLQQATQPKDDKGNTLKFVSYGIGGLVILISIILLVRKK